MKTTILKMMLLLCSFSAIIACSDDDSTKARQSIAFSLDPETIAFPATGGNAIINVHLDATRAWTMANTETWLTVAAASGTGVGHVQIAVAANTALEARSATVTVTSDGETKTVQITQEGAAPVVGIVYDIPPDATNMGTFTSVALTAQMGTGWNLGNSLEATGSETAWGNPLTTHQLIDGVKAAGFNTIRIPVSWSRFSDAANFTIDTAWMARVDEVVNYALDNDMYVIMNEHWDGGWMQPTAAQKDYVNNRLGIMWKQIATHFRDYDYHLIFAGSNEVMVDGDYGTPTAEFYGAQNSFNQTFVNTVRTTGGRNAYRYLTVQGFNTNINHTVNFFAAPEDAAENRLLVEVHFYDPFNFTLNGDSTITQWGNIATDSAQTETWANEDYVDAQFQSMKTTFIDHGFGVVLGEYGAISRNDVAGQETFQLYWAEYVSNSARSHGLVPVWWDAGQPLANHSMGIFDRNTGAVANADLLGAILP